MVFFMSNDANQQTLQFATGPEAGRARTTEPLRGLCALTVRNVRRMDAESAEKQLNRNSSQPTA